MICNDCLILLNSSLSVMNWLGTIPLHSFDKKTQTTNVAVDEGKEKVEHKTAELTNTPTGENHNV